VLLSSASIVPSPIPEVAPTKTAMGDWEVKEELAARMALIDTIVWI